MRILLWLLAGLGLYALSRVVVGMGGGDPEADGSVSLDALTYNSLAFVVLLGALACLIRAGVLAFRAIMGRHTPPPSPTPKADGAEPVTASEFDADAALERYLANKGEEPAPKSPLARRKPGGFGRRGL